MATDDDDIPETGAIFTYGKSRFADNLPSKFWIRNDKAVGIACGDEHSAIVTESGRLYTFGANDWGQLGLGHMKPTNKPGCVKSLKQEGVKLVACGRSHTIVSTKAGRLYAFGAGSDGQLGTGEGQGGNSPQLIESLPEQEYKVLSAGTDHSAALTTEGKLYVWGSGGEGQLGLGNAESVETPTELKMDSPVRWVSCGYYHTAIVTEDGKLYTFGEKEFGKLGLKEDQLDETSTPTHVSSIKEPVKMVACGGGHTAVITEKGNLYTFGDGNHGQLGHGPSQLQLNTPEKVVRLSEHKCKFVSCGDNHTAVITEKGAMYSFGDGRHGKLGLSEEDFCNIFKPCKVSRFSHFEVQKVSCGGCHMLVMSIKRDQANGELSSEADSEEEDPLTKLNRLSISANDTRIETAAATIAASSLDDSGTPASEKEKLAHTFDGTARGRRRQKEVELPPPLARTLPPLSTSGSSSPRPAPRPLPRQTVALAGANRLDPGKLPEIKNDMTMKHQVKANDASEDDSDDDSDSEPKQTIHPLDKKEEEIKAQKISTQKSHDTLSPQKEKTPESSEDSSSSDDEAQAQPAPLSAQKLEAVESKEDSNKKSKSSKESKVESLSLKSTGETKLDKEGKKEEVEETQITSISESSAAATPTITMVTPANNAGDAASTSDKSSEKAAQKKEEEKEDDEDEDEDEDESSDTDLEELDPKERKKREKERAKKEKEKQKQLEKERKEKEKAEKERLKQEKEEEKKRKKEEEARKKEEEKKRKEEEKKRKEEEKKAKSKKKVESEDEDEDDEDDEDDDEDDEDEESEESEEEKPLTKKEKERRAKEEAKKAKAREEAKKKEAAKKKKKVVESEEEDSEEESEEEEIKPKGKAKVDIFGKSQTKKSSKLVEDDDDDDEDDDESEDEEEMKNKQKDKEKAKAAETSAKNKEAEEKKKQEEQAKQQAQQEQKSKTCSIL